MSKKPCCDVLIIGSGIAGLSAAIEAAESGLSVRVLTKSEEVHLSNTWFAQGGIVGSSNEDNSKLLAKDIFRAGDDLNSTEAVSVLAKEGPKVVNEFLVDKIAIDFDKKENGGFDLTREAAHSVRRIYHNKDLSGRSIIEGLLKYANKLENIVIETGQIAVDLITNTHHSRATQERYKKQRVIGTYVFDIATESITPYFASAVVLATGGIGSVFAHTSNPSLATGDGISMAYRAGAQIINSEYVQFHPTTLFHRDVKNFLISESLRGEGAKLLNKFGKPFMHKYNPELKELAPRDEVSRAIYKEMEATGSQYVLLDATCIENIDLKNRFPGIYSKCAEVGIYIDKEPIPVVPAAHYFCGGVKVDLDSKTTLDSLYAIGETACTGVHGANRLASVSLLEGVYFGCKLGQNIKSMLNELDCELKDSIPEWVFPAVEDRIDPALINNDMNNIRSLMWNYTGIIRTHKRLNRALSDFNYLTHRIERFYREARINQQVIELRNAVEVASIITKSALTNKSSLGCHTIENK